MSHRVNDEVSESIKSMVENIILSSAIIRRALNANRDWVELLTQKEAKFLNEVHKAIKEYEDG